MMVGLADFQTALAAAVAGGDPGHDMLGSISGSPGLTLTTNIRRSWAEARAARAARLTLLALAPTERQPHLAAWADAGGGLNSFVGVEADAFLTFLEGRLSPMTHAAALCRFERAMARAFAAAETFISPEPYDGTFPVCRADSAAIIELLAPFADIVAAIDGIAPWPPVGAGVAVLVAPGVPGFARPATVAEVSMWADEARDKHWANNIATVTTLVDVGALVMSG